MSSAVFLLLRHPERHPQATLVVEGVQVPLLVAGDPAYPLLPWLIKGYSGPNLSEEQEAFNGHLNGSRVKVEHTFGHLKGRWRILAKRSDIHHSFMPTVVAACCVLHNICEMEKQGSIQPCEDSCNEGERQLCCLQCNDRPSAQAVLIRDTLMQYVAHLRRQ